MGLNVLMFGFDSVSRMTWLRNLPKSHRYFTETLGGTVLEGYNIVGDGTPQALLPILTGQWRGARWPSFRRKSPIRSSCESAKRTNSVQNGAFFGRC